MCPEPVAEATTLLLSPGAALTKIAKTATVVPITAATALLISSLSSAEVVEKYPPPVRRMQCGGDPSLRARLRVTVAPARTRRPGSRPTSQASFARTGAVETCFLRLRGPRCREDEESLSGRAAAESRREYSRSEPSPLA